VNTVGADQPADLDVRERGPQGGRQTRCIRYGQQLRKHGARIPVQVPEPAFGVPPAGAPRHPGHHDTCRLTKGRRPHQRQSMDHRVIPIDPVIQPVDGPGADIQLEWEPGPGRACRPEQERMPAKFSGAHHPG
jgi:hypothetical protein